MAEGVATDGVPYLTDLQILEALEAPADNLPARRIGAWSLKKLAILFLYFNGFTSASSKARGGYYVDAMAGPGLSRIKGAVAPPYHVWGSPIIALRTTPPFQQCISLELGPIKARALEARVRRWGERGAVYNADANASLPSILREEVPTRAPCFVLMDPEGPELQWRTVEAVARTPGRQYKPELLILFPMSMGFQRLMTVAKPISASWKAKLDAFFPNQRWWEVYQQRVSGRITPAQAQAEYLRLYVDALEGFGYSVQKLPVRMPGNPPRDLYYLIFASEHPVGEKIMESVMRRPFLGLDYASVGQLTLFEQA